MFGDAHGAGQLESCRVLGRIKTMAEGNTEQVTNSTDNFDIAAIAEELGIKTAPPTAPAAEEEKTEPDASADTGDQQPETGETPESADDETEGEDPTEDVAEDKEEDEKPESQDQEPEAPDKIQRRIDRITAEKHELREERDVIKAELDTLRKQAEAKPPIVTIEPDNPLSSFTDASALEAEVSKAQWALDWADDNRDGGSVTQNGEEKFFDADAVKQIKARAKSLLRAAPKQQEYLKVREQVLPEAQAVYPDFFKSGTTARAFVDATLKQYPWITRIPTWELVVGDAFVGQKMRMAKLEQMQRKQSSSKAIKSPAPAAAKVMKTPSPGARPKVSGSETALRQKAERVFKSGGNADALTDYLEAIV
jgi:hypothetical protein